MQNINFSKRNLHRGEVNK